MTSYYKNTNLAHNKSYILITRFNDASSNYFLNSKEWSRQKKRGMAIPYTKYQIKETDLQQKTATFTSTDYIDLTTGLYAVLISSPYHENFAGIIIKVDYDKKEGLYTYQCQDWSRLYQNTVNIVTSNTSYYNLLRYLISHSNVSLKPKKSELKKYKKMLSGLRPLAYYNMKWWNNPKKNNPLKTVKKVIIKDKTSIQAIRDICYGSSNYIKVYFNQNGVMQIEPFSRSEWLKEGVYVTTSELASEQLTFDTTNVITGVIVSSNDSLATGNVYSSKKVIGLDLSVFFGNLGTTVSNPNNQKTTTKNQTNNANVNSDNVVKGTPVHINTDRIGTASQDKKMLNDIKKGLEKKGYKVTLGARNPNAHYDEINKVKKNGIYFTIYGGLCAGTINEQVKSNHFWSVLKKKNARMVIGHKEPNKTTKWLLNDKLKWLPRAHDDNFSPASFKGISNPYKMIRNKGIGIATGLNATEIVNNFPNFKDSQATADNDNSKDKSKKKTSYAETVKEKALALLGKKSSSKAIITEKDSKSITNEKISAVDEISKPIRDLLKMKVTVPLGNPSLKKVHTNMFLYTELPTEFILANFSIIANAMKSNYSRNTGYKLNRWYIEGVTITNDGGNFNMDLELNPFPTPLIDYVSNRKSYTKSYNDAVKSKNSNNKTANKKTNTNQEEGDNYTSLGKRSDGKTACIDTFYLSTRSGQNNIKNLTNRTENKLSREKIGKTGTNYHNYVKDCKTAKQVYKKLCKIIPLKNADYANTKYKCPEQAFNHSTNLNCAEKSRLFKACCDSLSIPCVIYHVENHYMNGVLVNGRWETADLCYRSGIRHKDYNTAHFNK